MHSSIRRVVFVAFVFLFSNFSGLWAQSAGNAGTLSGTVTDSSGAVIPGAIVSLINPVSGYNRSSPTDSAGHYSFTNIPLNPYHLMVTGAGFSSVTADVEIGSTVPRTLNESLKVGASSTVPLTGFDTETVAPGIKAPAGSVTVPLTIPELD